MKTDDIRESFLRFFEERGHTRLASDSLVPANDPTLLFTGAGMNQFKDEFQGKGRFQAGLRRACTSQKCLRTGDLERVGQTPSHHTFFEMLGNFSFGDYFKLESMQWAWELVTKLYAIDANRLVVTCYEGDDDAHTIWRDAVGIPADRVYRFGEHANFWPADAPSTAPPGTLCGPCAEIFYDYGESVGCRRPTCDPSCSCCRFVEIWNLVFQQFMKQDDGSLKPLPLKNIDTGAGLERVACVLQGVSTDYETDIFAPLVAQVSGLCGRSPVAGTPERVRIHRVSDHVRGAAFVISDGVLPGNKGRGYVLRRIVRRAVRDGHDLGLDEPFLYKLVPTVVDVMGRAYPELVARRENLARIIKAEEESFLGTLSRGSAILADRITAAKDRGEKALPAAVSADLWDTYGFPFEITQQICEEAGLTVDRAGFEADMGRRQAGGKGGEQFGQVFDTSALARIKGMVEATAFAEAEVVRKAKILALVVDDDLADEAREGADVTVILDWTTFYAESGGQVGDIGEIRGCSGARVEVTDTTRGGDWFYHHGRVASGTIRKGDEVETVINTQRRDAIRRNHTATHLLHWALRTVLGQHAEQAGSLVAPDRLRFDFTHFAPLTPQEVERVEALVNERILENSAVTATHTTLEEARAQGAMALFGEKYGDNVRMISVSDFSKELCGGTHAERTGDIGLFKITSETGIAAGVRRIEGVTGHAAYRRVVEQEALLGRLGEVLKAPRERLVARAEEVVEETKRLARELEKAKRQSFAGAAGGGPFQEKARVGDAVVIAGILDGGKADDLRLAADQLRKKHPSAAIVLGARDGATANLLCAVTPDLVQRGLHAGNVVKDAARHIGGGGGGRPDMAQAGGKKPDGLPAALDSAVAALTALLEKSQP
ncbi:MAG TPA: alanine--tRNA ligase [Planctomycetota bacterium]|nr:alanine--tRNA ligase [Planctomycetota bacterium]